MQPKMTKTLLIDIVRWPAKKTNNLRPLYRIIPSLIIMPVYMLSGFLFYLTIFVIGPNGAYYAKQFKDEWLNLF
jgi:hypothetical protein